MSRVAHLFGNWKWTGPADPVISLVAGLEGPPDLFLGPCPFADLENQVESKARQLGLEPHVLQNLRKHWNPWRVCRAAAELLQGLPDASLDLLHTHLDADHAVAAKAALRLRPPPRLIRTVHTAGPHPARRRQLLRDHTDLCITSTFGLASEIERELGWPHRQVAVVEPTVDLERFRFSEESRQRGRQRLGLHADDFVVGIVARIQGHRRWDLLFESWQLLAAGPRPPKLLVLGRGTRQEELAQQPVRARGLQDLVLLPGYQDGQDYVDALAACDAGIFLVPGTDVACRAVREWMAMGRGVLATRRPPLPEIVHHGETGQLVAENPAEVANAFTGADSRRHWVEHGAAAARHAQARFAPSRALAEVRQLYRSAALARPGVAAGPAEPGEALAIVPPGHLHDARRWAHERGLPVDELWLFDPRFSRDVVLDSMSLASQGARNILLAPHPEWDRPFLRELARHATLTLLQTGEPTNLRERWLAALVPDHFNTSSPVRSVSAAGRSR